MTGFETTAASAVIAFIVGLIAAGLGGAGGGVFVGGKAIGNELAALMGGFYGPLGVVPGLLVGMIALALVR